MRGHRFGAAWVVAMLVGSVGGGPPARAEAPPLRHVGALPLAARVLADGAVAASSDEELERQVGFLGLRLLINDEEAALDTPRDLEQLVNLGVYLDVLEARGVANAKLRRAALGASYMMHLMGRAYATRESVRGAIDALPERAEEAQKAAVSDLVASVRAMGEVARAWFPEVLAEVLKDSPADAGPHNLRGLWLMREGRFKEAADAFAVAFDKSPQARFAVHLYDALLATGDLQVADQVRRPLLARAPALGPALDELRRDREDAAATTVFEGSPAREGRLGDEVAQIERYRRSGRSGAAMALAQKLLAANPGSPEVLIGAAELFVALRAWGRLESLLEGAEVRGLVGLRLREARVAAVVQARVDRELGQGDHALAAVDLEEDLTIIEGTNPTEGRRVRAVAALLELVARAQAARLRGAAEVPEETLVQLRKVTEGALRAAPKDPVLWRLAAAAYVAADRARDAMDAVGRGVAAVDAGDRAPLSSLLARMEAGYGVREGDGKLVRAAVARAKALGDGPFAGDGAGEAASWRAFRLTLDMAEKAFRGRALPASEARAVLAAMPQIDVDFDETTSEGRLAEAGAAATTGALAFALDRGDLAVEALRQVRRFAPGEAIAKVASGQAQLIAGDTVGAYEVLADAEAGDHRPAVAFALEKALAYAAHGAGAVELGARHLRKLAALWDVARAPEVVQAGSAAPVFIGDFHVGLALEAGAPLRVTLVAAPVVLLIPELPHDRKDIRRRLEQLDTEPAPK